MDNKESFQIVLQNTKLRTYIRLGYAFVVMNVITFGLLLLIRAPWKTPVAGLAVTLIYFLIRYLRKQKGKPQIDQDIFFLYAAVWLWHNSWMAILLLILGILFKLTLEPMRFVFTREGIKRDFFPKKKTEWNEMNGVVLKDGLLTLDYKDNRLMQALIQNPDNTDEQAFNSFASRHLTS